MVLLYSDTGVSSDCYELWCSLNNDTSVSLTKSGNHNQQFLEQNCAQESASWEVTPCCSKCNIPEDKILTKTSLTTSSLASASSCHNSTHPKQLFSFWILSTYSRKQYDLTTIPDHSELPPDTSAFWTDCLCTCKVEMDSKNKNILVCHTCLYLVKNCQGNGRNLLFYVLVANVQDRFHYKLSLVWDV